MKKHYADFATYALRAYFSPERPQEPTEAEQENEEACKTVCEEMDERTRNILKDVYTRKDIMSDNVFAVSKAWEISQDDLWTLISKTEKRFAKERGLI